MRSYASRGGWPRVTVSLLLDYVGILGALFIAFSCYLTMLVMAIVINRKWRRKVRKLAPPPLVSNSFFFFTKRDIIYFIKGKSYIKTATRSDPLVPGGGIKTSPLVQHLQQPPNQI